MSSSIKIPLLDLRKWLQSETEPIIKPLSDKGKSLLDEIKGRLDDVQENGDKLFVKSDKEVQKGSTKTYRCAKAANKMSKNISDLINRVAVPEDASYENLRSLVGDLEKTFAAIEQERRIRYRRISPYFILDRRRLDISIKRAEDSIQGLRSFLFSRYVDVKTAENMLDMTDGLSGLVEKAKKIQNLKTQTETRVKLHEEKIHEEKQKIGLIKDKTELDELSKLEQRIKDLKVKVKYSLRHLQKPFYKMASLIRRGQIALPLDDARKLKQYMNNPFEALTSEEDGHPILKRILQKLDDTMRSGKLKLKTARLRKAQEQIDSILRKDSLVSLHQDCLETILRKRQLSTSQTVTATQKELGQLQTMLQKLQTQKESRESRRRVLKEEHQRMLKKIKNQKDELEKSIFDLVDKTVQVVLTKANKTNANI